MIIDKIHNAVFELCYVQCCKWYALTNVVKTRCMSRHSTIFFPETYPIMVECVGIVGLATLHLSWVLQQAIFHTVSLFLPCRGLITYV